MRDIFHFQRSLSFTLRLMGGPFGKLSLLPSLSYLPKALLIKLKRINYTWVCMIVIEQLIHGSSYSKKSCNCGPKEETRGADATPSQPLASRDTTGGWGQVGWGIHNRDARLDRRCNQRWQFCCWYKNFRPISCKYKASSLTTAYAATTLPKQVILKQFELNMASKTGMTN